MPASESGKMGMMGDSRGHLAEAGMTYTGHMGRAFWIGSTLIGAGLACLVHGLIPSVFKTKASRTVIRLHEEVTSPAHQSHSHNQAGDRMWLEFEI